jgi:integrase/recombinase XerD
VIPLKSRLDKFILHLKLDRGLSPATVEAYAADVRVFLEGLTGPLASVGRAELLKHFERLDARGVGARSRARKLSALKRFFAFAVAEGWCGSDPAAELEGSAPARRLPETLSKDEIERLITAAAADGGADAIMLRLLYATGLRVSELVSLRIDQVDTHAGLLRVTGKGDKVRIVPIDPETCRQLQTYLKSAERRDALFHSGRGRPFTRQGFWKAVRKHAMSAGLGSRVTPHVLRHAFATHLLEGGMNLRSLQLLLGHSDISTTEIYSHVSTAHLTETLRKHHPKAKRP